ncbi:MAG: hypothetical protein AAGA22_01125 [Pseudomonadota bacterium]
MITPIQEFLAGVDWAATLSTLFAVLIVMAVKNRFFRRRKTGDDEPEWPLRRKDDEPPDHDVPLA